MRLQLLRKNKKNNRYLFRFRCHNMGFPCERVRHKIEHRENYICRQWSDDIVDDRLHASVSTQTKTPPTNDSTEQLYTLQQPSPDQQQQKQQYQNHYHHQPIDTSRKPDRFCWLLDFVLAVNSGSSQPDLNRTAIRPSNDDGKNGGEHLPPANGQTVNRHPQNEPIGTGIAKRITQLISFKSGHQESTPSLTSLPPLPATTAMPTSTKSTTSTTSTTTSTSVTSHRYLVRQSLCLYAASSFILVLCYFATSAAAIEVVHPM